MAMGCTLLNISITSRCTLLLDHAVASNATPGYDNTHCGLLGGGHGRRALTRAWRSIRAALAVWLSEDQQAHTKLQP